MPLLAAFTAVFLNSVPYFLSPWPGPRIVTPGEGEMDYEFDLHPTHSIIRLTVTADTLDSAHLCFYGSRP
jgi:hypothetical protein